MTFWNDWYRFVGYHMRKWIRRVLERKRLEREKLKKKEKKDKRKRGEDRGSIEGGKPGQPRRQKPGATLKKQGTLMQGAPQLRKQTTNASKTLGNTLRQKNTIGQNTAQPSSLHTSDEDLDDRETPKPEAKDLVAPSKKLSRVMTVDPEVLNETHKKNLAMKQKLDHSRSVPMSSLQRQLNQIKEADQLNNNEETGEEAKATEQTE